MDELLTIISDAAMSHSWLMLALAVVLLAVPIVLKALGKSVPIVDQLLPVLVGLLKSLKKAPPPMADPPKEEEGVSNVVKIDREQDPPAK